MKIKTEKKKHRRNRGSGGVRQKGRMWWFSYIGPDGLRHEESSGSTRKGDAERLVQRRTGARDHNLPVIPRAEQLTFTVAAQAVIDDFTINKKRSIAVVRRRITKHLTPYFQGRRMAGITAADVARFTAARQLQGIERWKDVPAADGTIERKMGKVRDVSNAEINRELQVLKRIFSLAIKGGQLATKPHIPMLKEAAPRSGFFEADQLASVLAHLPVEVQPVIQFAAITGWRVASEILPLEWRHVDFGGGEIRLDAGSTKNGEPRTFPMTADLRRLLKTQEAAHDQRKKAGQIVPWVFVRMVANGRGGEKEPQRIKAFTVAWKQACRAAGCPGRIPHDLRRTAVRSLVRLGIPERVAMTMTGHKTASIFQRYNIVSGGDLKDAARKLDAGPTVGLSVAQ